MVRTKPGSLWRALPDALGTAGRVDRVELKVLLDEHLSDAVEMLGPLLHVPSLRRVYFLDTPDLALARSGIVVRARELRRPGSSSGRRADVVVKLRRPCRGKPPRRRNLVVELDALPASVTWSGSIARRLKAGSVTDRMRCRRPARRLLDESQRRLVEAVDPAVDLDDLVVLGPIDVVRMRSAERGYRIDVESWQFPDGATVVELSVKCRPTRSKHTVKAVRNLIADRRIALAPHQLTKTQLALRLLAD
ncbi:hypothetical protein WEH80_39870 [Actinomycetes bacterium KLBMP 9759]